MSEKLQKPTESTGTMKSFFKSPARITLLVAVVFFVISLVENITGAVDISSPGTSGATLRFAIPLLMAGLGGLWAERAGVINIGLEGMMIVGTWTAAWFGSPWTIRWNIGRCILWIGIRLLPCIPHCQGWYRPSRFWSSNQSHRSWRRTISLGNLLPTCGRR